MNAPHLRQLADYIERQPPENFYQRLWFCGTAACVAGHCALMLGYVRSQDARVVSPSGESRDVRDVSQEFLGLSDREANGLFFGFAPHQHRDQAVAELRRLADIADREGDAA